MLTFTYTARDQRGLVQTGHLEALDEDEVVALLQHRGLLVTSISRPDLTHSPRFAFRQARARRMHGSVTTQDQVLLCQQLATLVGAGVPLMKSIDVICAQVESRTLLLALEDVRREVEAGRTFRDALAKHPAVFHKLWLNLVQTGEASGHLAQSLEQLARHFESAQHLQNETKTALTYPAFLVIAAALVLSVFVYWLVPKFSVIFETMHVELPPLTRIIIAISHAARQYLGVIIAWCIGVGYLMRRYLRTEPGRWMRDRLLLRLPLFHQLFESVQIAEFSRGLATLLESGVPLLSSLEILEDSATNTVYGRAIGAIRESVKEGKAMAEPMAQTPWFPPMVVQMVQVGEEVGELSKMVSRVAKYYEARIETFIARLTRLFEPIAILVMSMLVLVIVLSIFMPIFKMAGSAGGG